MLPTIRSLLTAPVAGQVRVRGWLRSVRKTKNVTFAVLNDGSQGESLQAVIKGIPPHNLSYGSAVEVHGRLTRSTKGTQTYELHADDVRVIGGAEGLPLQKKATSAEHLRTLAHLRPRTPTAAAILRLQSHLLGQMTTFFAEREFFQTLPPILTASDCEGAGETFELRTDLFRKPVGLAVSTQLHLESLAAGLGRVWTLSPTFRAEKSTTARHLAEFRMIEAELSFTSRLDDVMDVVEGLVKHLAQKCKGQKDIEVIRASHAQNIDAALDLEARWSGIMAEWPRVAYTTAVQQLIESGVPFQFDPQQGLQTEHELWLAARSKSPVFITHYPVEQKPFYMASDGATAECFDLLVPDMGELCGGSLREWSLDSLERRMEAAGIDRHAMSWYLDLRRFGSCSHGGFGIGFERLVGYLVGITNVREIAAFPRWVNHCVA
ncbi:asparaginyl-tRNA synthetase [Savitreella phatthalungensis]